MKYARDYHFNLPYSNESHRKHWLIIIGLVLLLGGFFTLGVIRIAYRGKLLPGAHAYGIYLGGLSKSDAKSLIDSMSQKYQAAETVIIRSNTNKNTRIKASDLGIKHETTATIDELYTFGRSGWIGQQLTDQFTLMIGRLSANSETVSIDGALFSQTLLPLMNEQNTPIIEPRMQILNNTATIIPGTPGVRASVSRTVQNLQSVAGNFSDLTIDLATYQLEPNVQLSSLQDKQTIVQQFTAQPIVVSHDERTWTFTASDIAGWLGSTSAPPLRTNLLTDAYQTQQHKSSQADFSHSKIQASLRPIAEQINQAAVDAKLTISGDRASVFQQSQDGIALDMNASVGSILDRLSQPTQNVATTPLIVKITKAEVSDGNLDRLGIKELLSEGVSYFPGSSKNRLQNIRVGTARYQGVLLKPGQVFSFGELLGEVGPAQGYAEGRVILEGRQESAYGGGLCQVSSTAFRAALLAGLPILERVNHAFAVSYYTQPYGVPGVDATIYYPQVDFKFKNDTDHHILIQTELIGTTLKFRFYGTKQKTGTIRGPFFVYGNSDPNVPSRTVFYRDITVNGQVTKTDTFYTTYKSALDFPVVD